MITVAVPLSSVSLFLGWGLELGREMKKFDNALAEYYLLNRSVRFFFQSNLLIIKEN